MDAPGRPKKTAQMTLDEDLVAEVDKVAKRLGTTRSAFVSESLRAALTSIQTKELERRHREGYLRKPVRRGEFSGWEAERVWLD